MSEKLPSVDNDFVVDCINDYDNIFLNGSQKEADDARLRLIWALVHSADPKHATRGRDLAMECLRRGTDRENAKDYRYLAAVGSYRQHRYVEARREASEILEEHPDFRQAEFLKGCIDDAIIREGLQGLGVAAAVAGVAGLVLTALLSSKGR